MPSLLVATNTVGFPGNDADAGRWLLPVAVAAFNTHSNVRNKHEERRDEAIKD